MPDPPAYCWILRAAEISCSVWRWLNGSTVSCQLPRTRWPRQRDEPGAGSGQIRACWLQGNQDDKGTRMRGEPRNQRYTDWGRGVSQRSPSQPNTVQKRKQMRSLGYHYYRLEQWLEEERPHKFLPLPHPSEKAPKPFKGGGSCLWGSELTVRSDNQTEARSSLGGNSGITWAFSVSCKPDWFLHCSVSRRDTLCYPLSSLKMRSKARAWPRPLFAL